jgi:hypothetical protein
LSGTQCLVPPHAVCVGVFVVVEGGVAEAGFGVEDVENNVRGFLH